MPLPITPLVLVALMATAASAQTTRPTTAPAETADSQFKPIMEAPLPKDFPAYTPVGTIEVKQYPAHRLARASWKGDSPDGLFMRLFQHIKSKDIPMSTPVESTYATKGESEESSMAFIYPDDTTGQVGEADGVEVMDVPAQQVVSIGERGRDSEESVAAARSKLEAWLKAHPAVKPDGELRVMSYNSPMVPDEKAYYEVQIPVKTAS